MGRRKHASSLEMLVEAAALLPWWAALALAIPLYIALHYWAKTTEPSPPNISALGEFAGTQIFRTMAMFLQYIVPGALVVGAIISAIRGRKLRQNFEATREIGQRSALLEMPWQQFEELVGEYFRRQGYGVKVVGGAGPDGGIDLELSKRGERFLVQCKQWRAFKVGVDVVRELYGVMAARGAVGGFVVTSGRFTPDAQSFCSGRNISLIDGEQLIASMRGLAATSESAQSVPTCPKCSTAMVKRTAQRGGRAGESFWGCSRFPKCNGTKPT